MELVEGEVVIDVIQSGVVESESFQEVSSGLVDGFLE